MTHQAWLNDESEEYRLMLLKKHTRAIIHINKPTFNEIKTVVDVDVDCLKPGTEMDEPSQLYLISRYPDMLYLIKDPVPEAIDIAIEKHPYSITQVDHFTEEQLIRAISLQPSVIDGFVGERRKKIESYIETYATLMK